MRAALLALALAGCAATLAPEARVANAAALAANRALPLLASRYQALGEAAIRAAATRDAAEGALATLREEWRPVWGDCAFAAGAPPCESGAWRAMRTAHDAWAASLARRFGGQAVDAAEALRDAAAVRAAYCALAAALPRAAAAVLPAVEGLACRGAP